MINRSEIAAVAARFGAPDTQIIRDHLISHVLGAIADWPDGDRVTFFGDTATFNPRAPPMVEPSWQPAPGSLYAPETASRSNPELVERARTDIGAHVAANDSPTPTDPRSARSHGGHSR